MLKKSIALLLSGLLTCAFAETAKYTSDVLSADIGSSGVVRNISYKGMPLVQEVMIIGHFKPMENVKKHDTRLFQVWDYSNRCKFERKGDVLIARQESELKTKVMGPVAAYKMVCTLTPKKITWSCEVKQLQDMRTSMGLFSTHALFSTVFFERGTKTTLKDGRIEYKVLPEEYTPSFKLQGHRLDISTEKGNISLICSGNCSFGFFDGRQWNPKNSFTCTVNPHANWTPYLVTHKAGTVWKWDYSISFEPEE